MIADSRGFATDRGFLPDIMTTSHQPPLRCFLHHQGKSFSVAQGLSCADERPPAVKHRQEEPTHLEQSGNLSRLSLQGFSPLFKDLTLGPASMNCCLDYQSRQMPRGPTTSRAPQAPDDLCSTLIIHNPINCRLYLYRTLYLLHTHYDFLRLSLVEGPCVNISF